MRAFEGFEAVRCVRGVRDASRSRGLPRPRVDWSCQADGKRLVPSLHWTLNFEHSLFRSGRELRLAAAAHPAAQISIRQ